MRSILIILVLGLVACSGARETDKLLAKVWERDQSIREQMVMLTKAVTAEGRTDLIDSLIVTSETMERIDAENMGIINSLLRGGLPQHLSSDSYKTIWIVIDHAPLEKQERYLPLIEQMAQKGLIDADNYALLYDRIAMKQNRPQRYGSQAVQFGTPDNMSLYICPVQDAYALDSLRATVGLSPLADYLKQLTETQGIEAKFIPDMTVEQLNNLRYSM